MPLERRIVRPLTTGVIVPQPRRSDSGDKRDELIVRQESPRR